MIEGYKTKDMKAAKAGKNDGVIKQEDDGIFYFEWKGEKHGFTLEENAEIALKRFKDGE